MAEPRVQVLLRLPPEELAAIDGVRGKKSRNEFIREWMAGVVAAKVVEQEPAA